MYVQYIAIQRANAVDFMQALQNKIIIIIIKRILCATHMCCPLACVACIFWSNGLPHMPVKRVLSSSIHRAVASVDRMLICVNVRHNLNTDVHKDRYRDKQIKYWSCTHNDNVIEASLKCVASP